MNRRLFLYTGVGAVSWAMSRLSPLNAQTASVISLVDQICCENGTSLQSPTGVKAGFLYPTSSEVPKNTPWNLCQWSSRFTLENTPRKIVQKERHLKNGSIVEDLYALFADESKSIQFRIPSASESFLDEESPYDIQFELDGQTEYEHQIPRIGQAWPHLLLERDLLEKPLLRSLQKVRLQLAFRIPLCEKEKNLTGWNDGLHTAQFLAYLTIQNLNRDNAGFGDYLWFGIPLFDMRHVHAPRYVAKDFSTAEKEGTGKMIFIPGAEEYFSENPHSGQWITIDRDILPLLNESLQTAWDAGYLTDSHHPDDYHLSMMNIGWEITAPIHAAAEIRGLSITCTK